MKKLIDVFLQYKSTCISVFFVLLSGIVGDVLGAGVAFLIVLMFIKKSLKVEFLFVLMLFVFFLGDSNRGLFTFANDFRFVILGASILYLLRYKLAMDNLGNAILPFSIVAAMITFLFSPIGIIAVFRSISFWLVALVVFKFFKLGYKKNNKRQFELLVVAISIYIFMTLLFMFLPLGYLAGRFKGVMGNPNGLGLLCLFLYSQVTIISYRKETNFSNLFFQILRGIILTFIFLTGSRTAFFSIIVYEVVLRMSKGIILPILLLLLMMLLFFFISIVGSDVIIENLGLNQFLRTDSLKDASGRADVWPVAWEEIKKHPVFGRGIMYDNYFMYEYANLNFGDKYDRQWSGVWSSYFSLLLDVGVIGSLVYALFYKKMYSMALYKNQAMAFIILCFLSAITESWMAASMNAFTPMMFLYWAIQTQPKKKVQ